MDATSVVSKSRGLTRAGSYGLLPGPPMSTAVMYENGIQIRDLETPGPPNPILLSAFALLLTAQIGLTLLLLTIVLAKIQRSPAFYNFVFITWVSLPIYLLLFYTKQYQVLHVRLDICAVQAILKHGVDSAFVCALLMLALECWWSLKYGTYDIKMTRLRKNLILILPYAHFIAFSAAIALLGTMSNIYVTPQINVYVIVSYSFYCTLGNDLISNIQAAEIALLVLATFFYEVRTGLLYRKMRKARMNMKINDKWAFSVFVRLSFCTLWQMIGLLNTASGLLVRFSNLTVLRDDISLFVLVTTPLIVLVIFSTQKDILMAWRCRWRETRSSESTLGLSTFETCELTSLHMTFRVPDGSESLRDGGESV
ncbi:hypothetical protein SISNIDRAFT_452205 [Sistotremastrum niveocremeum HHB9708]|uniref:Uncharacterized protein n=1 Tax=Sistotremastrum niveocremeum HHB9708 TaxID=1314777 RepID=A0A164X1C4_9AGAM|nr:hypothetical protein SISNIDRAFT_452205 [Sistotremastrum niveocremeum HHB9708]